MAMLRLSVAVPEETMRALQAFAVDEGVAFAEGARRVLDLGLHRGPLEEESPASESLRLLAEQARAGKTSAVIQYARMAAQGQAPPEPGGDPDDELALKRQRR